MPGRTRVSGKGRTALPRGARMDAGEAGNVDGIEAFCHRRQGYLSIRRRTHGLIQTLGLRSRRDAQRRRQDLLTTLIDAKRLRGAA